jgi:hypothetical protein
LAIEEQTHRVPRLVAQVDAELTAVLPPAHGDPGGGPVVSTLHDQRVAALLGASLGIAFTVCFLTGMYSHFEQHPLSWMTIPTEPAGLYRVTQGVHVATGIASIPLLFAKLWAVWPRFFSWRPVTGLAHGVERLSILPLVGGALFQVCTGVPNLFHWYWFKFSFTQAHYDCSYILIGALFAHLLAKWTITRGALARTHPGLNAPVVRQGRTGPAEDSPEYRGLMTRRGLLWTVGAASVTLTAATVGETVRPLAGIDLLAPRRPGTGPQHLIVNRSAKQAQVTHLPAEIASYRLQVGGPGAARSLTLTYDELKAMTQHRTTLPISCVEGWSVNADWEGVQVAELLDAVGARHGAKVRVVSVEKKGAYRTSMLNHDQARASNTLLAIKVFGEYLDIQHGFPTRLIAPNRPGVLQTKWVGQLVVS